MPRKLGLVWGVSGLDVDTRTLRWEVKKGTAITDTGSGNKGDGGWLVLVSLGG